MTSISKKVYIDKLDDIVNEYNNTYHKTIKMKPVDVKPSAYIDSSKDINYQDPKFKIDHIVRISKYKYSFAKGYVPNWSEEVFFKKKMKKMFHGHIFLAILTLLALEVDIMYHRGIFFSRTLERQIILN